jgi:hypothetical protein
VDAGDWAIPFLWTVDLGDIRLLVGGSDAGRVIGA